MPINQYNLSKMLNRATDQIIRPRDLPAETGLSKTSIWRLERAGDFPNRIRLSAGAVGYRRAEVQEWLDSRQQLGV